MALNKLLILPPFQVVDDFSSKVDFAREIETVESIDADHRQMVKCTDRDDPRYRAILGVLKRFMRLKSPEIMPELHTTKSSKSQREEVLSILD